MNLIFKLLFDTLHHHIYIIVVLMLLLTFCLKIFWRLACWTPSSIICASRFFPFTLVALVLLLFLCKLLLLIYNFIDRSFLTLDARCLTFLLLLLLGTFAFIWLWLLLLLLLLLLAPFLIIAAAAASFH